MTRPLEAWEQRGHCHPLLTYTHFTPLSNFTLHVTQLLSPAGQDLAKKMLNEMAKLKRRTKQGSCSPSEL